MSFVLRHVESNLNLNYIQVVEAIYTKKKIRFYTSETMEFFP